MKYVSGFALLLVLVLASCGKSHHEHHEAMGADSANAALNSIIMSKHDEVMPKMGQLYSLKKKLQDTIANTKNLAAAKKAEFEAVIASLDSANNAMMDWMHKYDPSTDSANQEKNRVYLENEIEKINKVGEQATEVIEKATNAIEHRD